MELRPLGNSGLEVSAVALGCWPMAGMSGPGANEEDSLATIRACLELGVNHLDTAYCYGMAGESERFVGQAIAGHRHEFVIATKGGIRWAAGDGRHQVFDASPATLRHQCETSLQRLKIDCIDLLYLHAPDRQTPIAESAGALKRLMEEGKTRAVGVSNGGRSRGQG